MRKLLLLLLLFSIVTLQADRGLQLIKQMKEEQRVALIVGNNNYQRVKRGCN